MRPAGDDPGALQRATQNVLRLPGVRARRAVGVGEEPRSAERFERVGEERDELVGYPHHPLLLALGERPRVAAPHREQVSREVDVGHDRLRHATRRDVLRRVRAEPLARAPRLVEGTDEERTDVVDGARRERALHRLQELLDGRRRHLLEPLRRELRSEDLAPDRLLVPCVRLEVHAVRREPPAQEVGQRPALRVERQRLEPVTLALGLALQLDEERARLGLRLRARALLDPRAAAVLELRDPHAAALEHGPHRASPLAHTWPSEIPRKDQFGASSCAIAHGCGADNFSAARARKPASLRLLSLENPCGRRP
jgi:hypothetical protein